MDEYKFLDGKKLRYGYTTGTCAAAAAKGAAALLLGESPREVEILTPGGTSLRLPLENLRRGESEASCAVRKDGGDDPDVTHGILVYATAGFHDGGILIEGGEGVGRITKPGLDEAVGEAAINRTPRRMIQENVAQVCAARGYRGGIRIVISIPGGEALAERTFNPRLGIVGGLSILGTTGIVEPMSDTAMIGAIRAELSVRRAEGERTALLTPGNYGKAFLAGFDEAGLREKLPPAVKCANFIGDAIDLAGILGFERILIAGHIGKLIKLVTGNFNTHSKYGDPRLVIFAAFAALSGPRLPESPGLPEGDILIPQLFDCPTSEAAIELLQKQRRWDEVLNRILGGIQSQLERRCRHNRIGAVLFSSGAGFLGCTEGAARLLYRGEGEV